MVGVPLFAVWNQAVSLKIFPATFPTDDGGGHEMPKQKSPLATAERQNWLHWGFMPLIHRKNMDLAAFIGAQSLHKPSEYYDPDATANARLSARCLIYSHAAVSHTT